MTPFIYPMTQNNDTQTAKQAFQRNHHPVVLYSAVFVFLAFNPATASMILSEIMYNPDGPDYYTEYVELYNAGASAMDLTGWQIGDGTQWDSLIAAPGNASGITLAPGEYALILDSGYWDSGGGVYDAVIPEETLLLTVPDAAIGAGGLGNSTPETVSLIHPLGTIVTQRTYRIGAEQGQSEECIWLTNDSTDTNWAFSQPGGTPGFPNSVTPPQYDLALDSLALRLEYDPVENAHRLNVSLLISNTGSETAPQNRIVLQADRHQQQDWATVADFSIPALEPDSVYQINEEIGTVQGGRLDWIALLEMPDDRAENDTLRASIQIPYKPRNVMLSEIMAAPSDELPGEWFELENRCDETLLPLGGWTIEDEAGQTATIDSSLNLLPVFNRADGWTWLVPATSSAILDWPGINEERVLFPEGWPSLNDDGDELILRDPTGAVIDHIRYPEAVTGRSFIRTGWSGKPNPAEWSVSPDSSGGSPGWESEAPLDSGDSDTAVVAPNAPLLEPKPNPFSPDGDGYEDETTFSLRFPAERVQMTLRVFDVNGRRMATLLRARNLPGQGEWIWDGRLPNGDWLKAGMYVFQAEATSGGRTWRVKGVLVSAVKT